MFGLDFGTTSSVISIIQRVIVGRGGRYRAQSLLNLDDNKPHPSVVWYSVEGPVVGRRARDRMADLGIGVFGDIVRSPKMFLGAPTPISVGGVSKSAEEVVADILSYLRNDALKRGLGNENFSRAVVTIPVLMQGPGRRALREAANKAGIRIHQFVHEPLAALYGYLRRKPNFANEISQLEGRLMLVFDWGGGTLDLTLCTIRRGTLMQVLNLGDSSVGGDQFDLRLKNLVRERHQQIHPRADWGLLQPTAEARLLKECEDAKIRLSDEEKTTVFVRDILAVDGPAQHLEVEITRKDFRNAVEDLIRQGLNAVPRLMEQAGVSINALEFCLATGGMVAMPAIREGLDEIVGVARLRTVENPATIISEGAAWIAHDQVRVSLAKPLEVLHADDSYVTVIPAHTNLPCEGENIQTRMSFFCVDPRDGYAKFQVARPHWPGQVSSVDRRRPYVHITLPVDPFARPLFERLEAKVNIDHDLIARIEVKSSLTNISESAEIWDLEFGVSLPAHLQIQNSSYNKNEIVAEETIQQGGRSSGSQGIVRIRSNIATHNRAWNLVPGEYVRHANPTIQDHELTDRQRDERMYYERCYLCKRTIYEIERDGCDICAQNGNALPASVARARWVSRVEENGL